MVNETSYDLILMDIQMPIMDGHEATRRLRALGVKIPIVALTAHAMKEERSRCADSGFTDFLSKPVDKKSLVSLIVKLLDVSKENP
jgi:CheY-like chemotaxis protein